MSATSEAATRIDRDEVVAVHYGNAVTGETPYWDGATGTLWWVDIQGQRVLGHTPQTGHSQEWNLPSMPGLVAGRRRGGLVIGLEDGLYGFDPVHGLGPRLVAVEADDPRTRVNDGKPDKSGRLWFGTMDKSGGGAPIGGLYRLDLDGTLQKIRENVRVPNAIAFSPEGTRFYFADTRTRVVEAMAYDDATGTPGASTAFLKCPDDVYPDGTCIDRDGGLWIALIDGGRIERRLPDGSLDCVVDLPVSRPTMAVLGGPNGRTLFVTSQRRFLSTEDLAVQPFAGDLLAVRVGTAAAPTFLAAI